MQALTLLCKEEEQGGRIKMRECKLNCVKLQ